MNAKKFKFHLKDKISKNKNLILPYFNWLF
jgi:hypothetical protein